MSLHCLDFYLELVQFFIMRIPYISIFMISLLTSWIFFSCIGDYAAYLLDHGVWVRLKEPSTLGRIRISLYYAVWFAVINMVVLWIWQKVRKYGKPVSF